MVRVRPAVVFAGRGKGESVRPWGTRTQMSAFFQNNRSQVLFGPSNSIDCKNLVKILSLNLISPGEVVGFWRVKFAISIRTRGLLVLFILRLGPLPLLPLVGLVALRSLPVLPVLPTLTLGLGLEFGVGLGS